VHAEGESEDDVSYRTARRRTSLQTALAYLMDRYIREKVIAAVVQKNLVLETFVEMLAYDATPLHLRSENVSSLMSDVQSPV
jgi:hypothetical protein